MKCFSDHIKILRIGAILTPLVSIDQDIIPNYSFESSEDNNSVPYLYKFYKGNGIAYLFLNSFKNLLFRFNLPNIKKVVVLVLLVFYAQPQWAQQCNDNSYDCTDGYIVFLENTHDYCPNVSHLDLVYEETFDNATGFNKEFWQSGYPWGPHLNRDHNDITEEENIDVSNGTCKLRLETDAGYRTVYQGEPYEFTEWFDFSSGALTSKVKFNHGVYEVRMRVNSIDGTFPSIWMWDGCAEIDFIEYFRRDGQSIADAKVNGTFNCGSRHLDDVNCESECNCHTAEQVVDFDITQWHTWTFVWTESWIDLYCDNVGFYRYPRWASMAGYWVQQCSMATGNYVWRTEYPRPQQTMHFILGMGTREPYHTNITGNEYMEIDYVRIYDFARKTDCLENLQVCNSIPAPSHNRFDGINNYGQTIEIGGAGCSYTPSDALTTFIAYDYINVMEGVDLNNTSLLMISEPCSSNKADYSSSTTTNPYSPIKPLGDNKYKLVSYAYSLPDNKIVVDQSSLNYLDNIEIVKLTDVTGRELEFDIIHSDLGFCVLQVHSIVSPIVIINYQSGGEIFFEKIMLKK